MKEQEVNASYVTIHYKLPPNFFTGTVMLKKDSNAGAGGNVVSFDAYRRKAVAPSQVVPDVDTLSASSTVSLTGLLQLFKKSQDYKNLIAMKPDADMISADYAYDATGTLTGVMFTVFNKRDATNVV